MPRGVYNHFKIRGKKHNTTPRESRTCPTCGNVFECRLKSIQKYCNRRCYAISLTGRSIPREVTEKRLRTARSNNTLRKDIETKKKIANSVTEHWKNVDREVRCINMGGKGHPAWNKDLTKETDERVAKYAESERKTKHENPKPAWNKNLTKETDERVAKSATTLKETLQNIWPDKERSRKTSISTKRLWQDPEYVAKQMRARGVCPNKAEEFLSRFFQDLLPEEYRFVGDGQFILAGKCPDFINVNGQKKIIELFGEHVHKSEEEQQRIDLFAQYGYQTLIIWYKELQNLDFVKQKVLEFNNV